MLQAFRQRLGKAAEQGRDAKELSEEVQAARIKAQERREAEKAAAKQSLADSNQVWPVLGLRLCWCNS